MIKLDCTGSEICNFRSPQKDQELNIDGAQNFIIKARIKRTLGSNWRGVIRWSGYTPEERSDTNEAIVYGELAARQASASEPEELDGTIYDDFAIVQWDMSNVPEWKKSIIHQINIQFEESGSQSVYFVDWVEIGGKAPVKYQDGKLNFPLRTNESKKRLKGTWAKVKYRAKTTDKFNIFAILAKYRKTY